jgi:proline dehydrogenase
MRFPLINKFTCNENQLDSMIKNLRRKNLLPILDYTNENFKNHENNFNKISQLISKHPNNLIAVKLSSLDIRNNRKQSEDYLHKLTELAINNNAKILLDAENYIIQDDINDISIQFMKEYNCEKVIIYKTYQMYRKDTLDILKNDLLQPRNYFIGCKLVRGAYYNEDYKYNILFDNIEDTHYNYDLAIKFFSENNNFEDKLICATHNQNSINLAIKKIKNNQLYNIEFAHLMGMSDKLSNKLGKNYVTYKYLPYGHFIDTLPYLIRRLYENYPMVLNLFK